MKNMILLYLSIIILGIGLVVVGTIGLFKTRNQEAPLLQLVVPPNQEEIVNLQKGPEWDEQRESRRKFNERLAAWQKQKIEVARTEKEVDRLLLEKMRISDTLVNCKTQESMQTLRERLRQSQVSFDSAIAIHQEELRKWKATLASE